MTAWPEGNVQANGITIHYYRTGDKNKPSILLLHGITDSGLCWSRVAADVEGSYDVIMTDARGHGHSGISAADVSIALLADDAAAVIRALGLQKPYLFGHSMGAITAATVAANYPDLVRAVVLEDPPLLDKPPSQTDINKALLVTNEEQPAQFGWQWLFDLRTLPREERIARGFARRTRIVIGMFGALTNESPTPSIADSEEKKQCKHASLETASFRSRPSGSAACE